MPIKQIDYDALPYSSMPFPQSQPTHLAALAALHGRTAAPVDTARVLELGCASGGNLIGLAARFPQAVFEGIDLAERHVVEGSGLVHELGLHNITLRQGDIAAMAAADLSNKRFDYIICHGVFSWVPQAVQEAIFRICAEHLSDTGIAYVSYNVLPGWHLPLIVRELCRHHAGSEGTPQAQIARARAALAQFAELSDEHSSFGKVLREEVQRSARMNDSHFQGEFLSAYNEPCRFEEFVSRADAQGLAYLCDAGLGDALPETLGPERAERVHQAAASSGQRLEQGMDFVSGRTFRRALLVKREGAIGAAGGRAVSASGLAQLHLACPLIPEVSADGNFVFRRDKAQLKTNDPAVGAGLTFLTAAYPETRSFADIVAHVSSQTAQAPAAFTPRLADALLRTVASEQLIVSSQPVCVGRVEDERPALWPLARAQLQRGQPWVSNLLHLPIQVPPAARWLAMLLDGEHTAAQISARLAAALAAREIVIDGVNPGADTAALQRATEGLFRSMLAELRRGALLAPALRA